MKLYKSGGCAECGATGYQGRIAIREVLEVNDEIRSSIMNRASAQDIKDAAIRGGMTTMIHDALVKVAAGLTTIEEVVRVVHE